MTGIQARAVGNGFAEYCRDAKVQCPACAILPDHVHLVVASHRLRAESLVIRLKGAATEMLVKENLHPFNLDARGNRPKCFARGEWKVFLNTEDEIRRAIAYVVNNPIKEGKPIQRWSFGEHHD